MPVIADMLKLTTELYNRAFNTETAKKLEAAKAAEAAGNTDADAREKGWFRGRKLFQLDLNYRWSTVVFDERFEGAENPVDAYGVPGHDVRAGDRAPDAPELKGKDRTTRLFDIFSPAYHTVLLFSSGDLQDVQPFVEAVVKLPLDLFKIGIIVPAGASVKGDLSRHVDFILEDTKGYAKEDYGLKEVTAPTAVIVRPDAMIGAFATSSRGVEKYLSAVFSRA